MKEVLEHPWCPKGPSASGITGMFSPWGHPLPLAGTDSPQSIPPQTMGSDHLPEKHCSPGITESAELKRTCQDHRVQLLALHSTILNNPTLCPRTLSKHSLSSARLVLWPFPWGAVPAPNYPLGEIPFPKTQLKPPLTQLQAIPSQPVPGHDSEEISAAPQQDVVICKEVSLPSVPFSPGWTDQVPSATSHKAFPPPASSPSLWPPLDANSFMCFPYHGAQKNHTQDSRWGHTYKLIRVKAKGRSQTTLISQELFGRLRFITEHCVLK